VALDGVDEWLVVENGELDKATAGGVGVTRASRGCVRICGRDVHADFIFNSVFDSGTAGVLTLA
jgi:hypothetical protein